MTSGTALSSMRVPAAAIISILAFCTFEAAGACELRPDGADAQQVCLAAFCDHGPDGAPQGPYERGRCVDAVQETWQLLEPCTSPLPLAGERPPHESREACIRRVSRGIEAAAERASRRQMLLDAIAAMVCARRHRGNPSGCFTPPGLLPPPPPDPYFVAVLRNLDSGARSLLYKRLRETIDARRRGELSGLEQAIAAAGKEQKSKP